LATNPHSATIGGRFIAYETTTPGGGLTAGLYGVAVCVPFLMSSHRRLVIFGMANIPVLVLLSVLLSTGLISLWCIWAAVWSVVIARHLRDSSAAPSAYSSRAIKAG
jgi:multisubunit Na+/H+ antiporter MnhB subunit